MCGSGRLNKKAGLEIRPTEAARHHRYGSCLIVGADIRTRRTVIGEPSDSNCSWYCRPFLSVAVQVMVETWSLAKLPF